MAGGHEPCEALPLLLLAVLRGYDDCLWSSVRWRVGGAYNIISSGSGHPGLTTMATAVGLTLPLEGGRDRDLERRGWKRYRSLPLGG